MLGAPVGDKNDRAEISLPEYLDDAPDEIRAEFVDIYLRNRAQSHDDKGTLTLREERADRYLQKLAALVEDVAGESVTVSDKNVIVSSEAAEQLYGKLDRPF